MSDDQHPIGSDDDERDLWAEMFRDPRVQASWWETVKYMRDEDNPFYARFEAKLERAKRKAQAARDRYVEVVKAVLADKNIHLSEREVQQLRDIETEEIDIEDVSAALAADSHDEFVANAGLNHADRPPTQPNQD